MKWYKECYLNHLALIGMTLLFSACTLGPDFVEPDHNDTLTYMGTEVNNSSAQVPASELGWRDIYHDPYLQNLIEKALANNLDMRVAQSKVQQALANQKVSDATRWPSISLEAKAEREEKQSNSPENSFDLKGAFAWELDLFGGNRRAREAALADLMATQQATYALQLSLIAQVADQFFVLKEIEQQLAITQDTLTIRRNELRLARVRKQGGVISGLEEKQAEVEVESAKTTIAPLKLAQHQAITELKLLVGDADAVVAGGSDIFTQTLVNTLEPNMPAELLKRRPDVVKARYQWESANALIGAAKADLFPNISLTGEFGTESSDLSDVLSGNSIVWSVGADILQPLFNAGKNRAALSAQEEVAVQAGLTYQKVVLQALKEVSDEIQAFQSSADNLEAQRSLVMSTREYFRLAQLRYRNGVASSLDLMDAQRQLFTAEQALATAQLQRLQAMTRLYRALAGGWVENTKNDKTTENEPSLPKQNKSEQTKPQPSKPKTEEVLGS